MTTTKSNVVPHLERVSVQDSTTAERTFRVALVGNPNTGKTTLFNRHTGLRHKTSNFPGTTLDARVGRFSIDGSARATLGTCCGQENTPPLADAEPGDVEVVDLPGIYSLELEIKESQVVREALAGRAGIGPEPGALCVVVDATNLARNLRLVGEALRRRLPTVVAVNMVDLARKRGVHIDPAKLAERLGCGVVLTSARSGEGFDQLRGALLRAGIPSRTPPGDELGLSTWADDAAAHSASATGDSIARAAAADAFTDRLDRILTHPVLGSVAFAAIMLGLFYTIFSLARLPMDLLDSVFGAVAGWLKGLLPAGILADFITDGVVTGIGATVIFLPQICLLFFLISLLEDTGYLARAAFVTDRLLRPFGLPGHAFVPLLSAHACALPAIMSCRAVPDPKQRLATILVAPFMTCSARIPVYALLTSMLFRDRPGLAALAFVGCYLLGILAGVLSALLARRTVLRGKSRPMALELPSYKRPSLRTALTTTLERGLVFVRSAGTNILAVCIVLWWLGNFPHVQPPQRATELRDRALLITPADGMSLTQGQKQRYDELNLEADRVERSHSKASSFLGRAGTAVAPVFAPIGYDWRLTIGVLASFAAREVFASTMAVVVAGEDVKGSEVAENPGIRDRLATATRDDGKTLVFTPATSWSLLVFFVLAMQCLPTLVVTARESGNVKWALLQLVWMSGVAYIAAFGVYRLCIALGAA